MDKISRMEKILRGDPIEPVSRLEIFCAMAAGTWNGDPLTPVSRLEYFLSQISGGGGGGLLPEINIYKPAAYSGETHLTNENQTIKPTEGHYLAEVDVTDEVITALSSTGAVHHWYTNLSTPGAYRISHNSGIHSLYLHNATSLVGQALASDTNLKDLIIDSASVCTLASANVFTSTPFASGGTGGTLWVPEAKISAYQSASNWSTILGYPDNQIKKIEGSVWE